MKSVDNDGEKGASALSFGRGMHLLVRPPKSSRKCNLRRKQLSTFDRRIIDKLVGKSPDEKYAIGRAKEVARV